MSRSRVLLLLCVFFVAALWYAWQETPRQQKIERVKSGAGRQKAVASAKNGSTGFDELNFSGGEKLSFKQPKRDLFRPLYRAPVVVAQPVTVLEPVSAPVPLPVAPPPPPPPPTPVVKQPTGLVPIQPLTVLGFLQKGMQSTVFHASRQGEIFLVKKGDRFADGLLLREINGDKIVISRGMDDPGVTLTVEEHKSQRMAIRQSPSGRPNVPEFVPPVPQPRQPAGGEAGAQ